jgi:hypothetical protein
MSLLDAIGNDCEHAFHATATGLRCSACGLTTATHPLYDGEAARRERRNWAARRDRRDRRGQREMTPPCVVPLEDDA